MRAVVVLEVYAWVQVLHRVRGLLSLLLVVLARPAQVASSLPLPDRQIPVAHFSLLVVTVPAPQVELCL